MALIVDNNPNPEAVEFNYTNCERVFWNSNLVWPDYDAMYFWIQPLADGVVKSKALGFLYNGSTHFQQSTKPISYSINGGDWVDTTVDALNVNVGAGQKLYLKSEYVAHSTPFAGILRGNTATANEYASGFSCNVNYRVGGSTNSLIKGNNETIKGIFGGQTKLTDASKLSIGSNIYSFVQAFSGCTALQNPPAVLPATTAYYYNMFYNCTALKSAPVIGLTTAVASCCYGMFQGCTSLTTAPEINAVITGDFSTNRYCFQNMFAGCTSLVSIPALKNTDVTYHCYAGMFYGCSALKFSTEQTIECPNEFRIPSTGTATQYGSTSTFQMIKQTSGTFTSDPAINTTYYTNATII